MDKKVKQATKIDNKIKQATKMDNKAQETEPCASNKTGQVTSI